MKTLITSASVVPRLSHFRLCFDKLNTQFTQTSPSKSSLLGLETGNLLNKLRTAQEVNIKVAF